MSTAFNAECSSTHLGLHHFCHFGSNFCVYILTFKIDFVKVCWARRVMGQEYQFWSCFPFSLTRLSLHKSGMDGSCHHERGIYRKRRVLRESLRNKVSYLHTYCQVFHCGIFPLLPPNGPWFESNWEYYMDYDFAWNNSLVFSS